VTGQLWFGHFIDWVVNHVPRIALITAIAVLARLLLRRAIDQLTSGANLGKMPPLLRPFKEKTPKMIEAFAAPALSERRAQRAQTIGSVLKSLATFLIFGIAFVMILGEVGVNLGPIIASAGILGLAIGFGAQNLVKDFLSGMFMMLEDQYGVGDVVDLGEATGKVEAVGLRVTTIRDVNGTVWYVRNGEVLRVGNSSQGFAVAVVDLPIGHQTNVEEATELARKVVIAAVDEDGLKADTIEPPEVLGVEKVTAESLTLRITVKVRPGRQWAVQRTLRAKIKTAFDDAGVEPPLAPARPITP
jgi:small conductance mechanosensitive channel